MLYEQFNCLLAARAITELDNKSCCKILSGEVKNVTCNTLFFGSNTVM